MWWVSTEPGFKKEENVLRWNVHQLHFLWAGEWGYGSLKWAISFDRDRGDEFQWIIWNGLIEQRNGTYTGNFLWPSQCFLFFLKQELDTVHFFHARSEKPPQTGWSTPGFSNCKHTPFSYFLCNSPSKFQVCFIFYPPLGKPCQWLGEAKILWFSDRNLLRSTMGAMEIWSTHFWMKIM